MKTPEQILKEDQERIDKATKDQKDLAMKYAQEAGFWKGCFGSALHDIQNYKEQIAELKAIIDEYEKNLHHVS